MPLRRIHALFAVPALVAAAVPVPAASQDNGNDGGPTSVTAAVQVTNDPNPSRAYASPQIGRNPKSGELVIATTEFRAKKTCHVFISTDEGRSWFEGGRPSMEPFTDCGDDPISAANLTVAFDPEGVLYIAHTAHDPKVNTDGRARNERPFHVVLARSTDSGRTFSTAKVYAPPEGATPADGRLQNRRPFLAVDPKTPANVYVAWQQAGGSGRPDRAMIAASTDGGRTFGEPVSVADDRGGYQSRPAVDGNGVVHIVTPTRGQSPPTSTTTTVPGAEPAPTTTTTAPLRATHYRSSSDQGKTWTEIKDIDQGNAGFSFARKQLLVADPNSSNLYFVWYGNRNPRAQRPPQGNDDREVFLRVSTDSGRTWSDAKEVNDDHARPDIQHYDPGMAVASNGRLDIAWYDFRNSPTPEGEAPGGNAGGWADVYYTYSTDGGRTLAPNVRISDRSINRNIGVWSNNAHIHAHIGITSTEEAVYLAWQDSRNGSTEFQAEDVYFATARFNQEAAATGDDDGDGVPAWILIAAGTAIGLGVAMGLAAVVGRRRIAA